MKGFLNFWLGLAFIGGTSYMAFVFFTDAVLVGTWQDWVVGIAAFVWLMIVVTVPWNAHFKAREVLDDAAISKRKDILVVEETLAYAQKVAKNSLYVALGLHVVSALALLIIALTGFTVVGYYAAALTALFAGLRPSIRYYEYLQRRLEGIRTEFRYPREDLYEVRNMLEDFKVRMEQVEATLTTDHDKSSWRQDVDAHFEELNEKLKKIEDDTEFRIKSLDDQHHEGMKKIAQDSAVLDSIRELVRFFKKG